jgi:ELWxxDGT repeat protein
MSHITTDTHHDPRGSGGAPASPEKPSASRRGLRHIGAMLAGSIVLAALLLVLATLAFAQSAKKKAPLDLKPFLVEDIYPGATSSEPDHLVDFKGRLLFSANHPDFGEELWKSQGKAQNTKIVQDIDPGPLMIIEVENTETGSSAPDKLLVTKKWLYFAATTAKTGEEIFKSNGMNGGTSVLKDIVPGPDSSGAEDFVSTGPKKTFFRAWDADHGEELWKTDGTRRGTVLVKDINRDSPPGARCQQGDCGIPKGWSHPDSMVAMGKSVYFAADDGKHGVELWKSDGSAKGTELVKDSNTTPGNSNPNDDSAINKSAEVEKLYVSGKTLYFSANDGQKGVELWKTDGTEAGTVLVKDINPSSASRASDIANLVAVGRTLYFSANDGANGLELWKTDGTEAGTTLVEDINPGSADSDPDQLTAFHGVLLFTANDGVHGSEPWGSDGTEAGTTMLRDLEPGAFGSGPGSFTTSGKFLYFSASNPSAGEELWAVQTRGNSRPR